METITNAVNTVTSTASKAIWGDQTTKTNETEGKEPISGETGNVKAGEPYDKGNDDDATKSTGGTYLKYNTDSSELPSTAAHTDTHPTTGALGSSSTSSAPLDAKNSSIAPGSVTAPVGDAKDDKTNAATQAALVSLQDDTKNLSINDKSATSTAHTGDGLVSAKKVAEGEGAHTGVKSDLSAPHATEPIGVKDTTEKSLATDKHTTTGTTSTSTPAVAAAATSSKPTDGRKSTSSSSSEEVDTATGQKKKKLSLKDKIKAKLHKH